MTNILDRMTKNAKVVADWIEKNPFVTVNIASTAVFGTLCFLSGVRFQANRDQQITRLFQMAIQ